MLSAPLKMEQHSAGELEGGITSVPEHHDATRVSVMENTSMSSTNTEDTIAEDSAAYNAGAMISTSDINGPEIPEELLMCADGTTYLTSGEVDDIEELHNSDPIWYNPDEWDIVSTPTFASGRPCHSVETPLDLLLGYQGLRQIFWPKPAEEPKEFHPFARLPKELRLEIWKAAFPQSRLVYLKEYRYYSGLPKHIRRWFQFLHTCHESRSIFLFHYQQISSHEDLESPEAVGNYVDPIRDTLLLNIRLILDLEREQKLMDLSGFRNIALFEADMEQLFSSNKSFDANTTSFLRFIRDRCSSMRTLSVIVDDELNSGHWDTEYRPRDCFNYSLVEATPDMCDINYQCFDTWFSVRSNIPADGPPLWPKPPMNLVRRSTLKAAEIQQNFREYLARNHGQWEKGFQFNVSHVLWHEEEGLEYGEILFVVPKASCRLPYRTNIPHFTIKPVACSVPRLVRLSRQALSPGFFTRNNVADLVYDGITELFGESKESRSVKDHESCQFCPIGGQIFPLYGPDIFGDRGWCEKCCGAWKVQPPRFPQTVCDPSRSHLNFYENQWLYWDS
ncbi:hypothetical protein HYFRA_00011121 [Hymenoscyphus fraxineus]|uniref:2EXR domain-containing protein n=1 Tax=Hymenoscyphus fraxineus TaxID=746836 RepID=A0A9N9PLI7_9HELO|nr:hypothetical protein HYFRA_00011121 [Hymenoscyphus fraxineus]